MRRLIGFAAIATAVGAICVGLLAVWISRGLDMSGKLGISATILGVSSFFLAVTFTLADEGWEDHDHH